MNSHLKVSLFTLALLGQSILNSGSSLAQNTETMPDFNLPQAENSAPEIMSSANGIDPCPQPRQALGATPNDLALIQEDITRFTLCLQRAQLLERLNTIAEENIDTIQSSLDKKMEEIAQDFQPDISTTYPAQAPSIPAMATTPSGNTSNTAAMSKNVTPKASLDWKIKDITGKNGAMIATIIHENGSVYHVETGDVVPDTQNKYKVKSITPTIIKVSDGKTTESLSWEQ